MPANGRGLGILLRISQVHKRGPEFPCYNSGATYHYLLHILDHVAHAIHLQYCTW